MIVIGNVDKVPFDVFFDYKPGAAGEFNPLALADGVKPIAFVMADDFLSVNIDQITGFFSQVETDELIVFNLP